ncbi:MFS transporter [Nocardia sp. CDC159]|uniref:MFS transporter n=1 Tax=Nocardia pulmonis TaxID=2951408 RepID=A0A9X2E4Q3_9NOCA|nr:MULTISPECIES: MFS transporter [Nocardia]MCM6773779.1 MFS transporter [Nocardia pulmonis]MCM6786666.1 MFS transporter [Nocardia sp. CDC159]
MATLSEIRATRRWAMLALGVFAQSSSAIMVHGTPFLLPALTDHGMSLPTAGLLVAMPTVGLCCMLIAWGYAVDRIGERAVLVAGPLLMCAAGAAAAAVSNHFVLGALLFVAGMGAASTNGASGRVIVGWFPPERRGLAMGIRQTAQPLGLAVGALAIPTAAAAHGFSAAMLVPAVMAGLAAAGCAIGIIDPPRPPLSGDARPDNPYRGDTTLLRIHGVSVLLVIPQATVWTFALLWLHRDVGLSLPIAGALVTVTQLLGAGGRIGVGIWSDRVGSRLRPLRTVAVAAVLSMAGLAAAAGLHWWWAAVPILVVASVITVADNGLAFTAVAEIAGPYWSGRGLGIQNTGQNLASAAIAPAFGAVIAAVGFPAAYLIAAVIAVAAVPLVPDDRSVRTRPASRSEAQGVLDN